MPGCQAGRRFLVINPDGALIPCAMVWAKYKSHRDMRREFASQNTCQGCFIATRANTERTLREFVLDNREILLGSRFGRKRQPMVAPVSGVAARQVRRERQGRVAAQ